MDIASLIGLVGTLGMIAGAMVSSGGIGPFIDTPSMLIVIGGTFFAVMYRSTLPDFLASFGTLAKVFLPGAKKSGACGYVRVCTFVETATCRSVSVAFCARSLDSVRALPHAHTRWVEKLLWNR